MNHVMQIPKKSACWAVWFTFLAVLTVPGAAQAAAPDLTATDLATINSAKNYNLGPTGMRGWIYLNTASGSGPQGLMTAASPWQILVVAVGTNTPSVGIMASNDVILGVSAGVGNVPVPLFTNDSRKSLGWAIGAAEAGDGVLNFKRWRAGVTNDVAIQLVLSNISYSATAPFDCPKSALILSNAGNIISNKAFNAGAPGDPTLGLALLASGNTNYLAKARAYAYSIAPTNLARRFAPGQSTRGEGLWIWDYGYRGVFLGEYFLLTGDTNVLHGLNEYAVALAQAQSRYGTFGHGGAVLRANGEFHGTIPPYGPVNSAGLVANMAIVLGKKAVETSGGVVDPELNPAIERAAKFFAFYVQKGNIPYGEHEPWFEHAGNGKESTTALMFTLMGDRPVETEYWTRMVVAGYNGREYGHTGQGFSYLWGAMAANIGGTNAAAAYLKEIRWHLDLSRRSDGSFTYDGDEQYGGSTTYDYWNNASYYGIDPTASHVLTYALAKQKLLITGRSANPTNWLSPAVVSNAIWAGTFDRLNSTYSSNELVAALSEYDPLVRRWAATGLGARFPASASSLITMAGSTNALLREAACQALGVIANPSALTVLGQRLNDPDVWVRARAAVALRSYSAAAASPLLTNMLTAFITNATDPNVIVWDDPLQNANRYLSLALFGNGVGDGSSGNNVASYTINANTNLLYPAVRIGLQQPDSYPRVGAASFANSRLTLTHVKSLLPDLFEVAAVPSQADTMWSMDARGLGISTLAKHRVAEAVPLALSMLITPEGFGWNDTGFKTPALKALTNYGDSVRWTMPVLRGYVGTWDPASSSFSTLISTLAGIDGAITSPATITNLYPVANSQVVVTTNATAITLTGFSWRSTAVSFANVTAPAHGTLTGTPPNLIYTPAGGYTGLDRFTFQVSDGVTNSPAATVSLIVGMPAGKGLRGEYFDNADFTMQKFFQTDPQVNFDWGSGSPSNTIAADTFSVRWSGLLLAPETGSYQFSTLNNDGARLYVNGQLLIDDFVDQTTSWIDGPTIALTAGQKYELQMDYYENTSAAVAKLKWSGSSFGGSNGVIIGREWLFDGSGESNRAAIAYPQSVTLLQNTTKAIALSGAGNPPVFTIATPPANGALTGTPPNVTYTPTTNFSGTDSFTFTVNNGLSNSAPAMVSIGVWAGQPVSFFWKSAVSSNWSVAANWTNAAGAAVAPDATGQPFYSLNFNRSGTYTVTNDLNNGFLLNQLNVAGAVTFAGANAPAFAGNGPILPQLNQNSASAVTFNAPVILAAMTSLGGSGGGPVTINSMISGAGGLTVNNQGTLTLNYGTNTYSGGTILNAGTVTFPAFSANTISILGTGPLTINSGVTLACNRTYFANSVTLNGGTITAGNSFSSTFAGPVTLGGIPTFDIAGNFSIPGNMSGPGGLVKSGNGSLSVSGTNTCTGATLVTDGTLTFTKPVSVGSGAMHIDDGAVVNLNYSGNRTIAALTLGGTNQPDGIYGGTNSPATTKDAHFTGTGTVTVNNVNEPPSSCMLTSPTNGQVVALPPTLTATATDPDNDLAMVSFYADGTKVGEDTTAPYSFTWSNATAGAHALHAVAIDAGGRQLASPVANVTLTVAMSNAFVSAGTVWRYFDKTNDLGTAWRSNTFSDVTWSNGPARLGFGNDGEVTKVASNRQWTTYFRRAFYVPNPTSVQTLAGRLTRDDAAVLYLNGAEIWRDSNLPAGVITNQTPALASIAGETNWIDLALPPSTLTLLTPGWNLLAAEVHQSALNSSDLGFNFELIGIVVLPQPPELNATLAGSSLVLTAPDTAAYFRLFSATNLTPPVVWTSDAATAVLTNGQWRVTITAATNGQRFYRLEAANP